MKHIKCLVTSGPTCEPLDEVRRMTNHSTGRLGSMLADFLLDQGCDVTLLASRYSVYRTEREAVQIRPFTTTAQLFDEMHDLSNGGYQAVFHVAAVSDYKFGNVYRVGDDKSLVPVASKKFSSRIDKLMVELVPTPKIISRLRSWYPKAFLVGWKYEVEGDRSQVLEKAIVQLKECNTDSCVANGPAYGSGFGYVMKDGLPIHAQDEAALFRLLLCGAFKHHVQ
jgi:phosphopantothenoylcysteine decarboxylase/phosphopantothenate--cysteine ligase